MNDQDGHAIQDNMGAPAGQDAPAILTLEVQEPWFSQCIFHDQATGRRKTVEGRVGTNKWAHLAPENGKHAVVCIRCVTSGAILHARVTSVRMYGSLNEYLDREWGNACPAAQCIAEAVTAYANVWTTSKDLGRDAAPVGQRIQVFSDERVEARGGMTAIEFVRE
jgi:ASC-1-like (ASCH) protein